MCVWGGRGDGGGAAGRRQKEPNTQPMTRAEAPAAFGSPVPSRRDYGERAKSAPSGFLWGVSCRTIWDRLLRVLSQLPACSEGPDCPAREGVLPPTPGVTAARVQANPAVSFTAHRLPPGRGREAEQTPWELASHQLSCKPVSGCVSPAYSHVLLGTFPHPP